MKADEILQNAVDKKSPAERTAYLEEVCGDDQELLKFVKDLLRAHDAAGRFLEGPLFNESARPTEIGDADRAGMQIGPYKLLQQIGEGGMGTVWMAEQTSPVQRRVALKI